MEFLEFVEPSLLILIAFLYAVGLFLKGIPAFTQEWLIPIVVWGLGIVITMLFKAVIKAEGFTADVLLSGVIQGTFIAATSVFGNEIVKQVMVKRKEDR